MMEILDSNHQKKLFEGINKLTEEWVEWQVKAEQEGKKAEANLLMYFVHLLQGLCHAVDTMMEVDDGGSD